MELLQKTSAREELPNLVPQGGDGGVNRFGYPPLVFIPFPTPFIRAAIRAAIDFPTPRKVPYHFWFDGEICEAARNRLYLR